MPRVRPLPAMDAITIVPNEVPVDLLSCVAVAGVVVDAAVFKNALSKDLQQF